MKMNFKKYKERVLKCPLEYARLPSSYSENSLFLLTAETGIYSNFPVLVHTKSLGFPIIERPEIQRLIARLARKEYTANEINLSVQNRIRILNQERSVLIQGQNLEDELQVYMTGGYHPEGKDVLSHRTRQIRDYNILFMFHPEGNYYGLAENQKLAPAVIDFCEALILERLPFCLPRSMGWNHENDLSRVVYYKPGRQLK
jgi:hypothetical protein